jgi:hypothetical protein
VHDVLSCRLLEPGEESLPLWMSDASAEMCGQLRLSAALSLLRLARRHDTRISPTTYTALALMMQDEVEGVRAAFAAKVYRLMRYFLVSLPLLIRLIKHSMQLLGPPKLSTSLCYTMVALHSWHTFWVCRPTQRHQQDGNVACRQAWGSVSANCHHYSPRLTSLRASCFPCCAV